MTWNQGTSTDYLDLLDDVVAALTSRYLDSIAIVAGGADYDVGEIIAIDNTGSTRTLDALIEVTAVDGGGAITAARVYTGGAYTVIPSDVTAVATVTTGLDHEGNSVGPGDDNATFDLTFTSAADWTQLTRRSEVDTVDSVASAGSGYSVSDTLTLVGGALFPGGAAATFNVDSVSTGQVTAVSIITRGDYEVFPADPVVTTVAPAGGTGCTLNLTPRDVTGDTIVVLQGDAGSATDPLVAIKTYSSETDETGLNTVYNWAMFSMTAWSAVLNLHNQSNISPGLTAAGAITTSTSGNGCFVPLKDAAGDDIEWWLRHDGRSFELFCKTPGTSTTHYAQAAGGLLEQFGTTTELPYPAFIAASSDRKRVWYQDLTSIYGGLAVPISRDNGPLFVWSPDGAWLEVKVATISGNQVTTPSFTGVGNLSPFVVMWPLGETNLRTGDDSIASSQGNDGFESGRLTLASGAVQIYRTPDTGGDKFPLFPLTPIQGDSSGGVFRPFGRIPGVFWFSQADSSASSEDRFDADGIKYRVFQNGTRTGPADFCCVRES